MASYSVSGSWGDGTPVESESVLIDERWERVSASPDGVIPSRNDIVRCVEGDVRFDLGVVRESDDRYATNRVVVEVNDEESVILLMSSERLSDSGVEVLRSTGVDWTRVSSYPVVAFDLWYPRSSAASHVLRYLGEDGYVWFDSGGYRFTSTTVLDATYCSTPLVSAMMSGIAK